MMSGQKDVAWHRRRSLRLKGYDYGLAGAYFVTICTHDRACLFGEIVDGQVTLNEAGRTAADCWRAIPSHFPDVELDAFVIMPNHVHGIICITGAADVSARVGAKNVSPLRRSPSRTVGSVVRGFKVGVTKWARTTIGTRLVWQRSFYEHIVRDADDLVRIRRYILENPARWRDDPEFRVT